MIITKKKLIELHACNPGLQYFDTLTNFELTKENIERCVNAGNGFFCTWLLPRIMTKENTVKFAIYSAEQSLPFFETLYLGDNRPRLAIEAAKSAADAAADAAARAAYAAARAAYAAARAAYAAARAADAADADAADAAARAANVAYADGKKEMQLKICMYGLTLINSEESKIITEEKKEVLFLNLVNPEEKLKNHKRRLDMLKKKSAAIQKNCAPHDTYKKREHAEMAIYCFIALAVLIIGFGIYNFFNWVF